YVAMLDELGLGDYRILFNHFNIPCTSLDDGLVLLMADEDIVKLLEYMHVYVKEDVSVVEQHVIELDKANEVELELEDEIVVAEIFADLDEAYGEDVDSHLDEALVHEEVGDLGMFDNLVEELNEVDFEVEDEVSVADIFAELKQAYEEDIDSHLGEALVLEEVGIWDFLITYVAE
ncbi:hypothetical protein Tco_1358106, partial [Tanacetum coccineum]